MDFLNHLMIGFLVSSWASGSFYNEYVVAGILMAALPDFDFLLYPLWKRLTIAGHHGITHTFIFIIIISIIIFLFSYAFTGFADVKLLLIMLLAGSSHIFCDFITNWGVPAFYPVEKRYLKINLDMAVNPYLILFFFLGTTFLTAALFNYLAPLDWQGASSLLGLTYIAYFVSRSAFKFNYARRPENQGFAALPTWLPHKWKFAKRTESDEEINVVLKDNPDVRTYAIPKSRRDKIAKCEDLPHSWLGQVQLHLQVFGYPYYETDCNNGRMEIIWRSAEMGNILNVHVLFESDQVKTWVEFRRGKKTISRQMWAITPR
jgi:membrane-bound metal-dependent hydrolase YbcI (DUF457 family)